MIKSQFSSGGPILGGAGGGGGGGGAGLRRFWSSHSN
eukprot:CAMPEP_0179446610 /NCGR_PEP_ID=MMETSP0799-20121207/30086_1 /TAXON_ID=46947 /ORGANISM="Geminigera cryophila, Strain CCMP2564" /LENGTH=36 /DNA_ID= /DNA_START= /DNA_END= /DNA_ORIENTATION=